jgi:tRNA threonylcarbamoyladenosine biosynthesis protein TsaB
MELCIDTSTRFAGLALSEQGEILRETTWRSARNHSVELVPSINNILDSADKTIADVTAVITARGPGAFSALRVGMSTAKSIASGRGIPLAAVSTMDVEVEPYLGLGDHIIGVIPAGRNRVYTGEYKKSRLTEIGFQVRSVSDVISCSSRDVIYCGEGVSSLIDVEHGGKSFISVGCEGPTRRASFLARLGFRKIELGNTEDPQSLEPIYVRSAQITSAENSKKINYK